MTCDRCAARQGAAARTVCCAGVAPCRYSPGPYWQIESIEMTEFVTNAEMIARSAMATINPALVDAYGHLIGFLALNPGAASKMKGKAAPEIGTEAYIQAQALSFCASRRPRAPQPPTTVPDEMVPFILENHFQVPSADLARAQKEHLLSMGAENMVGDLLERYLASVMEPHGWIWCSGATVKAVDFIKPATTADGLWHLLQVKNRDNSENSSSAAIRNNTSIQKWFRTFSKKVGSNWDQFPDLQMRPLLSEAGFRAYVKTYLHALP